MEVGSGLPALILTHRHTMEGPGYLQISSNGGLEGVSRKTRLKATENKTVLFCPYTLKLSADSQGLANTISQ